jgi:hypothetical protein
VATFDHVVMCMQNLMFQGLLRRVHGTVGQGGLGDPSFSNDYRIKSIGRFSNH